MLVFGFLLLCLFHMGAAQVCEEIYIRSGLTEEEKTLLLQEHNEKRNQIAKGAEDRQPKAANMLELTWDDKLARLAQNWSDHCIFEHGMGRLDGKDVGQNLAIKMSTSLRHGFCNTEHIVSMVGMWYDEVKDYSFGDPFKHETGHYTQLVWANTKKVGCGMTAYKNKDDRWYNCYLACNYSPPGNYIGEKPYKEGEPDCEHNEYQKSSRYDSLCVEGVSLRHYSLLEHSNKTGNYPKHKPKCRKYGDKTTGCSM